jgi:hypothetical protein
MGLQDRIILLLEDDPSFNEIKDIFASPLNLVKDLVKSCFAEDSNQGLLKYERKLDAIKKRVAGVTRAHSLSSSYKIAGYSSYLFAFQQFFHSSFRARQGGVLEAVVYYSLKSANANPLEETKQKKRLIMQSFGIRKNVSYDIDVLASKSNRILLGQIRSTDITGGTTAKGSLVDLLRFILREKTLDTQTRYLIIVWEPLERQQKPSLINKIWDSLRSEVGQDNEAVFKEQIDDGWQIPNTSISVKLVYGIDELGDEISNFADNETAKSKLKSLWESIQKWDDLWLTYAIASFELENLIFKGYTNFQILNKKLQELNVVISNDDLKNYETKSIYIAEKIAREWKESTLPVSAPAEVLNYLIDLVLLKMISEKVSGYRNTETESLQSFL